jgi:cytochrome c-type biogenesis protein CcmF
VLAIVAVLLAKFVIAPSTPLRGLAGVAATLWVGIGIILYALKRWREAPRGKRYTPEMLGMIFAHFGVALFLAGVLITDATSVESDQRFAPNETRNIGGLDFRFVGVQHTQGPNYLADEGTIEVRHNDQLITTLHPQKRQYSGGGQIQTKSDIDPGITRDLYVALGEPLDDAKRGDGAWAVRVYVKPFVRWIWLGGLFMMFGGFIAAADRRFRTLPEREPSLRNDLAAREAMSRKATPSPPNAPLEGEGLA